MSEIEKWGNIMGNILVIDDDLNIRTILSKFLVDYGHQVTEATDGEIGIEILEQNLNFKVVITDIRMPNKSGNDVARHIKNNSDIDKTPVIGVTGFMEDVEKELFDFLLEKPFKIKKLMSIIDKL